jgi:dTMP kinase
MAQGKFITFEGGEGAGKSTQVARLAERLRAAGLETVVTREPGGTPLSEAVRALILDAKPEPVTELLLFAAARAEHVGKVLRPALAHGSWVVCDRFIDSTRVYQGLLAGTPPELIAALEAHAVAPTFPNLTVILDVAPDAGLERIAARGALSRFDAESLAYHHRLRDGFREIARAEPARCVLIDAGRPEEAVAADVWRAVESRLLGTAG